MSSERTRMANKARRLSLWLPFGLAAIGAVPLLAAPVTRSDDPTSVRGAVYIPAGAYNAPQMWENFSAAETARDFSYARSIHLNALRIWASYEVWRTDPKRFGQSFDTLLDIADKHDIRILVSLFENDGVQPTSDNIRTTDPARAFAIQSPGRAIAAGPATGWVAPQSFVAWFMHRYRNDGRLIAIEVMNEPNEAGRDAATVPFAKAMFLAAKTDRGTVPLTIGTDSIKVAADFVPLSLDLIEFHDNFPPNADRFKTGIEDAVAMGQTSHLPVWLTEWQRIRPGGSGWGRETVTAGERGVDYASLAPIVRRYPIGSFFWSLMVKKAYLPDQRFKGTVNGLFWPDGAVASLHDARAIADDDSLKLPERAIPPDWGVVEKPVPSAHPGTQE